MVMDGAIVRIVQLPGREWFGGAAEIHRKLELIEFGLLSDVSLVDQNTRAGVAKGILLRFVEQGLLLARKLSTDACPQGIPAFTRRVGGGLNPQGPFGVKLPFYGAEFFGAAATDDKAPAVRFACNLLAHGVSLSHQRSP